MSAAQHQLPAPSIAHGGGGNGWRQAITLGLPRALGVRVEVATAAAAAAVAAAAATARDSQLAVVFALPTAYPKKALIVSAYW